MMRIKIERDQRITLLQWLQQGYIDCDTVRRWEAEGKGEYFKLPPLKAEDLVTLAELNGEGGVQELADECRKRLEGAKNP
ncbi:MAG: hypothetical protein IKN78_11990 [Bacteroidales bacterium]|jgi:hypothetical protein|nr:hypothetical protein [Bacteroidales bacterium]